MIRHTFLLFASLILATYAEQMSSSSCRSCDAYGRSRRPNSIFKHRDGCWEYECKCECDGSWVCPAPNDICTSDKECRTCWAGNAVRETNKPFTFTEDCYKYNCFCACDGSWDCPKNRTENICHTGSGREMSTGSCRSCDAFGSSRRPNFKFKHRDGCREYNCKCECDGSWSCPPELVKDICTSDNECRTCWAGNAVRETNKPFTFTEDCYKYNCFCACDGSWDCPKNRTEDICNTDPDTGCYYCTVGDSRHKGGSYFKHVNGCIEYDCTCNCDGSWNCPGELAVDTCRTNPNTGCYYCNVNGDRYEGNSYFKHTNGCIEYNCVCNCDGSWNCPGEKARDLCRQNATTGCYYCEVDNYLYHGNSVFDLVRDCYKYSGCTCACDGGWTCKHTTGEYVCDSQRKEISSCNTCLVDGKEYRGNSMFSLERECVKYICNCDCNGRLHCPSSNARRICENGNIGYFASIKAEERADHAHTRSPRQVSVSTDCSRCYISKTEVYDAGDQFTLESDCNLFQCYCKCDGSYDCPSQYTTNICTSRGSGSSRGSSSSSSSSSRGGGVSGGSGGITATSAGSRVKAIGRGTVVGTDVNQDLGVNVCRKCEYLGVTYDGNKPFTFEKGCFQYNCFCECSGSFSCPSDRSQYICDGRKECVRCDLTDYDGSFKKPNTEFQIRRGCDLFEKCRCNCDGGWQCEDGVYTCELKAGCEVDGLRYAEGAVFELTRGCDKYKDCMCHEDGRWTCGGKDIEDLCGQCRKCKIGDTYYDGDTTFSANYNCTRYSRCTCKCDGTYECRGGRNSCDVRGDQIPECTDCLFDGRRYRQGQSFDHTSSNNGCTRYRGCECRCGQITCREVDETCGDCRSCNIDGKEYPGGSVFGHTQGCYEYSRCECNCNGRWECFGDSAKDICNTCRKCNVDGTIYDPYTKFKLDRKCWNYQCFCLCNGTVICPSETVVNTCNKPDPCRTCEVDGSIKQGNSHFNFKLNGMDMYCRCNCDGSYVCVAEWMYIKQDVSISGTGIGSDVEGCSRCLMDGRSYRGDSKFSIARSGFTLDCDCFCNGGYYCIGKTTFEYQGCRQCSLYGKSFPGDTSFPLIYNGLKLSCECECDGSYVCYGAESQVIISCTGGSGCLPTNCGQCIVDGTRFNGLDQFGTIYREQNLRCDCGCDGSYYCEGSGGLIISCVGGKCVELGCSSCEVFGKRFAGGSPFELYYKGLKLGCQCECGGSYRCYGSNREIVVQCIDGNGCLTGTCRSCVVNNRRYNGRSTFRYNYNSIDMLCNCACDGSYYCEGISEIIQISCVGGQCTRLDCASCNVFGLSYEGDSSFDIIYTGLKLKCRCSCDSGYVCYGESSTAVITCLGGRGSGCLPSTCSSCLVNNREYAGRSTFRSSYKGIDIMCTCGCDGTSYCAGITASIEVSCTGNTCTRIGCKECSIFGREYIGGSQFDMIYQGSPVTCECDCDGGYICKGSTGITIITCVNGFGPGCLISRCSYCEVEGRRYDGASKFQIVYEGIDMECTCSCDSSYYCKGMREEIYLSCYGGKCSRPIGCRQCSIFGQNYEGVSKFDLVYAGMLLNCQCGCDGSYFCLGEENTKIIQCRNGRGNCLDRTCLPCQIGGQTLLPRSTGRVQYDGYDLNCMCGCDGSVYCTGIGTKIIITCIGGVCTPSGCSTCRVFGEEHRALSTFNIIYSGYKLNCRCDCSGGYFCEGAINLDCRDTTRQDCLIGTCQSCSLEGRQYRGNSVFKYSYNGIDVSCTCGCDGSVFCQGVTEIIELRCVSGSCFPIGCRDCRIFDRDYKPFSNFDIIYQGVKLDCNCACDSSYFCIGSSGERVVECLPGRNCLTEPCRKCVVNGRRYDAYSTFPHKYKNIDMQCTCGCDGTSYCEGTEIVIYVSCIGDTCSQIGCKSCSIFGKSYEGDSTFDIIYKGVKLDCTCACDTSYRCIGSSSENNLICPAGRSCVTPKCKKCRVDNNRYDGGQTFQYDYKGVRLNCICGCDGSYYCRGVSIDIEYSCFRRGGCKQIGGCQSCNIFGVDYAGGSSAEFVYQGYFMKCQCNCDSGYKCLGRKDEIIIECAPGRDCLSKSCGTCRIDGREFEGNTQFDYLYNGKDMRCTCGCDGSYYCRCKDDGSEISCNRRGSCTWIGCNTCMSDGIQHQAYEEFEKYYDNIRMNCLCSCDGSYRCQGVDRRIVIICKGDVCNYEGCRTCIHEGREYQKDAEFEILRGSERKRCKCRCDGTSECTTVVNPSCISCTIDGVTYKGHSRQRVYRDSVSYICDCYCNGTSNCYLESRPSCRECVIGGQRYSGSAQFEAVLEGTRMQCSCDCDGNFVCKSDYRTCTTSSGCIDVCPDCFIDGKSFGGNTDFQADVFGSRMQCSCDCRGGFTCRGNGRTCTTSGCVDNCRRCNIDGQTFKGNTNFDANVFGLRMKCDCDCSGSFTCRSEYRTCSSSGCVDNCRRCNIDGQSFEGNTNFKAQVFGQRMDCNCDCTGSFSCRSDTRTCTSSGCVDNCRRCNIDGQSFERNTNFKANVFGQRMDCSCDCTGSFNCRSDTRTCTNSGCVDNCRRCSIDGQSFQGNTNFVADVFGLRMDCSCDCTGSFSCRSDTRTCTSSGCVDNCKQCVIDGQKFQNDRSFLANVFGDRMQCSCDCSGSYTCSSSRQTCTSVFGCRSSCQSCSVNGRSYSGDSEFETVLQGIRMKCSCDCTGSWVCRGGTYTCTSFGCTSSCQGCEIEGKMYDGNTRFEIFHNAYGIPMTCECQCGGSYTCKGTKEIQSCVGSGCDDSRCNDCVINNIKYKGNTQFEAMIDGLRMQCTCSCNGGYRCTGTRTEKECYGPGCSNTGCLNCLIRGRTYAGNTQFDIDGEDGVRLRCMCDCDGRYSCKGEKSTTVCVGSGCDGNPGCNSCVYEGREYAGRSVFHTVKNGINMECTCACTGEVRCEGKRIVECDGPDCFTGCRRCVIDTVPYSGNTRFNIRKGNVDFSCICYCDGSYSCKGSTGFETSCVGESCAADQCRNCKLFNKEYQLDARFRLAKNGLIMNCVCECDGAYRCFSISGTCTGDDCDVYGCKSCSAEGKVFGANTQFELSTGLICTCQCNGEYTCRSKSLQIECIGADCGVGSGCRQCNVDGDIYPGNKRFQIRKYGLLMQCACNCDSSYTCRGYQIISDGESSVGSGCSSCEINGRRYNGNTRFQVMINGERSVCSCDCDGTYSCQNSEAECRNCVIGRQKYTSNTGFSLIQNGKSLRCLCDCSGNFICEGREGGGACRGNECGTDGCNICTIFGVRYKGNTRFSTEVDGMNMLCECLCTGEYTCRGYRQITNVILPAKKEKICDSCYVAGTEHPGNSRFKIQRGCFQIECVCGCSGMWECPDQIPVYTCPGGKVEYDSNVVTQHRYSIAGTHVYTKGTTSTNSKQSVIYTGEETSSVVFGEGGTCQSCFINEDEYDGNTEFVLQDGCLRWTCACDCSGGWNCSAVTGSQCEGPLSPFEHKQCKMCEAYGGRYPPNKEFVAEDKCYQYTCMCNCDGSWECPRELTKQICSDTSSVYDPEKGTCRQCIIGPNKYDYGETFDLIDNCINYKCLCQCDGKYNCPASTGVRVCREGSGSPGRLVTTGSNTIAQTGRTVVAIRPSGYGTRGKYSSTTGAKYTSSHSGSQSAVSGEQVYTIRASESRFQDNSGSLTSILSGTNCNDCVLKGESVKGGRDFTYRSGCIEHLCNCYCNGTHYCDPEKEVDFCKLDRDRAKSTQPKGCTVGNRTYTTALFSYEDDCKKYYCRCYDDGTHHCYPNKTKIIC